MLWCNSDPVVRALYEAIRHQNIVEVQDILKQNASYLKAKKINNTPVLYEALCEAAQQGGIEVGKLLLDDGAFLDCVPNSYTPLSAACNYGKVEFVKLLLENGAMAAIEQRQPLNNSLPLFSGLSNAKIVKMLLAHGANVNGTHYGTPALVHATQQGYVDSARLLLQHGADINCTNSNGETALYVACFFGHLPLVKLLLEFGPSVDKPSLNLKTPLSVACMKGSTPVVQLLVEHGASIVCGTPLFTATCYGRTEVVKVLLKMGANVNCVSPDTGQTPLIVASQFGIIELVKILLSYQADYTLKSFTGNTALNVAINPAIRQVIMAPIVSFLCGHHMRCGQNSILRELPQFLLVDIALTVKTFFG